MTPRLIRKSDLHPALAGPLADDLVGLVGDILGELICRTWGDDEVHGPFDFVVDDGVSVVEGDRLLDAAVEQPVHIGHDDLAELRGVDVYSHVSSIMQRRCHHANETLLASRVCLLARLRHDVRVLVGATAGVVLTAFWNPEFRMAHCLHALSPRGING